MHSRPQRPGILIFVELAWKVTASMLMTGNARDFASATIDTSLRPAVPFRLPLYSEITDLYANLIRLTCPTYVSQSQSSSPTSNWRAERDIGSIVVNSRSSAQRQRFSVAHELGHFLNPWHKPLEPSGWFACRPEDLRKSWGKLPPEASHHLIQETEANRFAIEFLAPQQFVRPFLRGIPDLTSVLRLSKTLDLSREASARRYVELHDQPTALVFSVDGVVRYVQRHPDFPSVLYQPGQRLSELPSPVDKARLSAHEEADPRDWLVRPGRDALIVQTLSQSRGHATTLLALDLAGFDDDDI
jgi:IrrE N-terminal-like domain